MRRAAAALAVAGLLVGVGLAGGRGGAQGARGEAFSRGFGSSWDVYHGNPLGTGAENASTALRPLRRAWASPALDGQLYGEPLLDAGRVIAATENDTVYALAARTGRVLWSRHVGRAVPSGDLPCGDIGPVVGITGTPVIDPSRGEVFVVDDELRGGRITHRLVGLALRTGRVELDEALNPPGSAPAALLQRPGLTLDRGRVVAAFGGNFGDCATYRGTVAAVPEQGGAARYYLVDRAPGERQGAIWMGGGAPLVDAAGGVWFAVGNGSQGGPPYDGSDSVTELSATLALVQLFAPRTWGQDNRSDADLGSAAPAFVDGYVFQVGKAHTAYLLNPAHLGGVGHPVASMPLCGGDPHGGEAVQGDVVDVGCGDGVTAVRISRAAPHLVVLWRTPANPNGAAINGPPIIAGGLVWSIDADGTLWGLDPTTGRHVVEERTGAGEADHFPTPAVADGLLLVPTTDRVFAYAGPAGRPPAG